jgi:hypothetical protein
MMVFRVVPALTTSWRDGGRADHESHMTTKSIVDDGGIGMTVPCDGTEETRPPPTAVMVAAVAPALSTVRRSTPFI